MGNTFTAEYTIASATGGIQEGLLLEVPLDASSRYGGIMSFRHTAAGLEIGSYWVPPDAPDVANASWRSEIFTTVDAAVPHDIRVQALFLAGASDVVNVWVDDVLVSGCTGLTTWEHYYNIGGAVTDRTVNELTFRRTSSAPTGTGSGFLTGLPPAPATQGLGFLFTGISYGVTDTALPGPTNEPVPDPLPTPTPDQPLTIDPASVTAGAAVSVSAPGFQAGENVAIVRYPGASIAGWLQADPSGAASGQLTLPADAVPGDYQLQLTGAASGCTALGAVQIVGEDPVPTPVDPPAPAAGPQLAASGSDLGSPAAVAAAIMLTGALLLAARRMRRRAAVERERHPG